MSSWDFMDDQYIRDNMPQLNPNIRFKWQSGGPVNATMHDEMRDWRRSTNAYELPMTARDELKDIFVYEDSYGKWHVAFIVRDSGTGDVFGINPPMGKKSEENMFWALLDQYK